MEYDHYVESSMLSLISLKHNRDIFLQINLHPNSKESSRYVLDQESIDNLLEQLGGDRFFSTETIKQDLMKYLNQISDGNLLIDESTNVRTIGHQDDQVKFLLEGKMIFSSDYDIDIKEQTQTIQI